jgi:hypothetical protein
VFAAQEGRGCALGLTAHKRHRVASYFTQWHAVQFNSVCGCLHSLNFLGPGLAGLKLYTLKPEKGAIFSRVVGRASRVRCSQLACSVSGTVHDDAMTIIVPAWSPLLSCVLQEGRTRFSAEPSPEDMTLFWHKSPIAHVSQVQGPMIFMLGAKDRRVSVMQLTHLLAWGWGGGRNPRWHLTIRCASMREPRPAWQM